MLVVFDEFQEVAKYSEKDFEKRLRKAIQGHQDISYFFSGSQKHILIDMFDSTKRAFYKMARGYPLAKIGMPHYIEWAQKLFRKKQVNLPEKIVSDIVSYCEFQPMYIQQFLFDLWRSSVVSEDLLDHVKKSILARQRNQFMVLWDLLTQNQRKALKLLVETGSQGIYTAAQLQRVGFNTGSVLHRALQALIEKEIIYKNNSYQFQDAMFKNWLAQML